MEGYTLSRVHKPCAKALSPFATLPLSRGLLALFRGIAEEAEGRCREPAKREGQTDGPQDESESVRAPINVLSSARFFFPFACNCLASLDLSWVKVGLFL